MLFLLRPAGNPNCTPGAVCEDSAGRLGHTLIAKLSPRSLQWPIHRQPTATTALTLQNLPFELLTNTPRVF
jgi:hypothetical protein